MHRSRLALICLDVPHAHREASTAFWSAALGARSRVGAKYPEYCVFEEHRGLDVMLQSVGDANARIHLDIHTDNRDAECARLAAAGAERVGGQDDWVVMREPSGLLFCVVQVPADDPSLDQATSWE